MGRVYIRYIDQEDDPSQSDNQRATSVQREEKKEGQLIYACKGCQIHLAEKKDLISKVSKQLLSQTCCSLSGAKQG